MNDFKTETSTQKPLDPSKRVNYTMGLVMGKDEFEQEQIYLMEKNRLHNRALHGYGTICGLRISVRDTISGPEVVVFPGIALNPLGQEIRVPDIRCAPLNTWLSGNKDEIAKQFPNLPPGNISAYVVLCYWECGTDKVPIPGVPCRNQDEIMADSRIQDKFTLSLRIDMDPENEKGVPSQKEEEAVGRFGDLLNRIKITDEPGTFVTWDEMETLVKDLIQENGSQSPPDNYGSPVSDNILRLHSSEASDILKHAFCVWVTQVRPAIMGKDNNCNLCSDEKSCSCVRLARLDIPVIASDAGMKVNGVAKDVLVNNDERPFLLHTRLLQEWLLCGRLGTTVNKDARTFVTLFMLNPTTIRAWVHYPNLLNIPVYAVAIDVDDRQGGSPPQQIPYLISVTPSMPETNVFDLVLSAPLSQNNRMTVHFDSRSIIETVNPLGTLHDAFVKLDYAYLDREGDILEAYLVVDYPALDDLSDVDAPEPGEDSVLTFKNGSWKAIKPVSPVLTSFREITGGNNKAGGDLNGNYPGPEVVGLRKRPIIEPGGILDENAVLKHNNGKWIPAKLDHGSLNGLDNENDHQKYLLKNGARPLEGHLNANSLYKIINLDKATAAGDAVRRNEAITIETPAGNDLNGKYPNPVVQGLQQRPVADISPKDGQVLAWDRDTNRWEPKYFVEAKSEIGVPYAIVAAGFFRLNNTQVTYNGLNASREANGYYKLKFPTYKAPDATNNRTYIVKGTVQGDPDKNGGASFQFVDFQADGIRIKIIGSKNETLAAGFMIEISEFGT
jgi:hypothetical protein